MTLEDGKVKANTPGPDSGLLVHHLIAEGSFTEEKETERGG